MAISNDYNFNQTRDEIITDALRIAGSLGDWETANAQQISNSSSSLQSIVKMKQQMGMPLWRTASVQFPASAFVNGVATMGEGEAVNIVKPLKVLQVMIQDTSTGGTQRELELLDRQTFLRRDLAQQPGIPNAYYFQPLLGTSELWLTLRPDDYTKNNCILSMHYQHAFSDIDAGTDNMDFPSEWLLLIQYELASVLSAKYGLATTERGLIETKLKELRKEAEGFDVEEGSLFIRP